MTTFTTYVNYGDKPWLFLRDHYGLTAERAKEIYESEPQAPRGDRERFYQRTLAVIRKCKDEVR
jgi:hypothetical protein